MKKAPGCCVSYFFSAVLLFSLLFFFSLQSPHFGIVAMPFFELLSPAGSIFATLLSPFGPAMGARLVDWARDRRLLGPAVRWFFPADPPVSMPSPAFLAVRDDALLAAVEAGLKNAELTAELRDLKMVLQQLIEENRALLEATRQLGQTTYTVTCNITPQAP